MVTTETLVYLWAVVALCIAIAVWDPATRLKRWLRSGRRARHATGRGKPDTDNQQKGAVLAAAASSPMASVYGIQVLCDREIPMSSGIVLGHYIRRASRAPEAQA
jgi:hypothetical protein